MCKASEGKQITCQGSFGRAVGQQGFSKEPGGAGTHLGACALVCVVGAVLAGPPR